jgi:hypothetical protein
MANTKNTDTILLDYDTINRESQPSPSLDFQTTTRDTLRSITYLLFEKWMKDTRIAHDCIDANAILVTARKILPENIVIIDARNYNIELIQSALEKARYAWYPLDQWHPTFALIADDIYLLRLLPILANTFYIQPQIISNNEFKKNVKGFMGIATIYRLFGLKGGRFANSYIRFTDRIRNYAKKIITTHD